MKANLIDVKNLLTGAQNVLILTHIKPDGDALGSAFALKRILRLMGKRAEVLLEVPLSSKFESYSDGYLTELPEGEDFDLVVAVDVADEKLLPKKWSQTLKIDLAIDHHPSNTNFARTTYLDIHAAATGEIIYELLKLTGVPREMFILEWIYIAVITDTGCFRFGNTTATTLRIGAELFDAGVDGPSLNRPFILHRSKNNMIAQRAIMDTLEFCLDDRVTLMYLTNEIREKTGVTDDDMDGFAQIPKSIDGVEVGIFFKQEEDPLEWRLSIRTSILFSASEFAQKFGGGGHRQAAGCNLSGTAEEVREIVLSELQKLLDGKNGEE